MKTKLLVISGILFITTLAFGYDRPCPPTEFVNVKLSDQKRYQELCKQKCEDKLKSPACVLRIERLEKTGQIMVDCAGDNL